MSLQLFRTISRVLHRAAVLAVFASGLLAFSNGSALAQSRSLGNIPWPFASLANLALLLHFPRLHSLVLTQRGTKALSSLVPGPRPQR